MLCAPFPPEIIMEGARNWAHRPKRCYSIFCIQASKFVSHFLLSWYISFPWNPEQNYVVFLITLPISLSHYNPYLLRSGAQQSKHEMFLLKNSQLLLEVCFR